MDAARLNAELSVAQLDGAIRFEDTPIGPRAIIATPDCQGELYLHGAHVTRFAPRGHHELLYLSPRSLYTPGKAIRGGIPVIWPWFGDRSDGKPGPAHGFARTAAWRLVAVEPSAAGLVLRLALDPTDATRALDGEPCLIELQATFGEALTVELAVTAPTASGGTDGGVGQDESAYVAAPRIFEAALHTYLAVPDIHDVAITGLAGTSFIDKTDAQRRSVTPDAPLRITRETDQVHLRTDATCVVEVAGRPLVEVAKIGARSTVVWNPWIDKTRGMADLPPDDWQRFVCIEAGNIADDRITLAPGATHRTATIVRAL